MYKWIILSLLVMFLLLCYAVGLFTIVSTVRTKIKALRLRWQYRQALAHINSAEPKQSNFFSV